MNALLPACFCLCFPGHVFLCSSILTSHPNFTLSSLTSHIHYLAAKMAVVFDFHATQDTDFIGFGSALEAKSWASG